MDHSIERIRPLELEELGTFFKYLSVQLSEINEEGSLLFQPVSRDNLRLPEEKKERFSKGLSVNVGQQGWRRAWVAISHRAEFVGHIDLRGHTEDHTKHRALLGMGVSKNFRRRGLGKRLIETAVYWSTAETAIEWIDLWVLSNNTPALELYRHTGFEQLGQVDDMFRIDGSSEGYILMTRKIQ
ncbi:MAG: GNAT family N-acetyltransferase [Pseudomonadota bacterium]